MSSMNRVTLTGHLGRDPVVRTFGEDNIVAEMSIAVQDRAKKTSWWDLKCYSRGTVEKYIVPYIKRGALIGIDGRLCKDVYEKDGVKQSRSYIVVESLSLLSSSAEAGTEPPEAEVASNNTSVLDSKEDLIEDDVPF